MKIGVKTYSNYEFLKHFETKCDFYEIQGIQSKDYSFIKHLKKEIVIHAEHNLFGVNFADKNKEEHNLRSIKFAQKLADIANSKKIILHPGKIENENCSVENFLYLIKKINDKRIILENLYGESSFFNDPIKIKEILQKTKLGLCLDLNHAIVSANLRKQNYLDELKELLKLNPVHFHIGGQVMNSNTDSHISFGDKRSDINMEIILRLFPKDASMTFETTTNIKEVEYDIEFIKKVISKIN